jgi:hypothetical protein
MTPAGPGTESEGAGDEQRFAPEVRSKPVRHGASLDSSLPPVAELLPDDHGAPRDGLWPEALLAIGEPPAVAP